MPEEDILPMSDDEIEAELDERIRLSEQQPSISLEESWERTKQRLSESRSRREPAPKISHT
jgi:hypothetical protein